MQTVSSKRKKQQSKIIDDWILAEMKSPVPVMRDGEMISCRDY